MITEILHDRINALVKRADEISAEHWKRMNFTFSPPPKHRADYISDKWVRVVNLEERNGAWVDASVYAFVALQDGYTKALGFVKAGDIHKAASYKTPAKRARGSVFQEDFGRCLTEHGVVYLR
jgi:hypothetical protein